MENRQIQLITTLMKERGMSIAQLAKNCDISSMTIRRILKDESYNPTIDTIRKIANALGTNERDLMDSDSDTISHKAVKGYIDYLGKISRIETFKQLESIYMQIKSDLATPKNAKEIVRIDKVNKKTQSKQPIDPFSIDLTSQELYDTSKVATWDFRRSEDERDEMPNDLGNMCKGYEFEIKGIHFLNSEAAYICGLFSENTKQHQDIQKELIAESNGYATKKVIRRKYEYCGRKDWETFNVQWMLYVIWCKVRGNKAFIDILNHIPTNCIIVENSTHKKPQKGQKDTSAFWGTRNKELEDSRDTVERDVVIRNYGIKEKELSRLQMKARNCISNIGMWEGVNCMGKILTICKSCIENGTEPPIDYDLLKSKKIHLLDSLLTFDDEATPTNTKAVIFDFDGTLLDTDPLLQYEHLFKDHKRGTIRWKKGRTEYLSHVRDCEKWDGINDVIEFIRTNNIQAAIVTANTKDRVIEAIKANGWEDVFKADHVIGCYAYGMKRTSKDNGNPVLFQKAVEVMGIPAANCIAFGNEISDYQAAKNAGMQAYNCMWGAEQAEQEIMLKDMPDVTLKNPTEIIDVIKHSL